MGLSGLSFVGLGLEPTIIDQVDVENVVDV